MKHKLVHLEDTENDNVFKCELCEKVIGFNKKGIGEPYAELVNGEWVLPENPEQWMGECDAAV